MNRRWKEAFSLRRNLASLFVPPPGRVRSVDGLRALSLIWVILFHVIFFLGMVSARAGLAAIPSFVSRPELRWMFDGHFAVDIFFVISGFLISGLLYQELEDTGSIDLGRFYWRRALRLCPTYFFVLTLLLIATPGGNPEHAMPMKYAWANFVYLNNFVPIADQFMGWSWSLAVEEQFYLLCPLLLLFIAHFRVRASVVFPALLALSALIPGLLAAIDGPIHLTLHPSLDVDSYRHHFDLIYDKIHTRYGALLIGVIAAHLWRTTRLQRMLAEHSTLALMGCALSVLITFGLASRIDYVHWQAAQSPFYLAIFRPLFSACVVFILLVSLSDGLPGKVTSRILSSPVLYPVAQLSYSAYLIHPIVIALSLAKVRPERLQGSGALLAYASLAFLAVLIAALALYLGVERPLMNLRAEPLQLPGPLGLRAMLRFLKDLRQDYMHALERLKSQYGDRIQVGPKAFFLFRPEDLKAITRDQAKIFAKTDHLVPFLGRGIVTANGEAWRSQRRLVAPEFHQAQLEKMEPLVLHHAQALVGKWAASLSGRPAVEKEVSSDFAGSIFELAAEMFFGASVKEHSREVERSLKILTDCAFKRSARLIRPPMWLPLPSLRRAKRARRRIDRVVYSIIRQGRGQGGTPIPDQAAQSHSVANTQGCPFSSVLSRLMNAREEGTGRAMNDLQLRDEIFTLLTVGHDTTANALTWCIYELAARPEVQDRALAEVQSVLRDRAPRFSDLEKMPYLRSVILESLRLHPVIPLLTRQATADTEISGVRIPKGAKVIASAYLLHRDPRFWENPLEFRPERFTADAEAERDDYLYLPFGKGQRACLGASLAMLELQLFLALILQNVELALAPGYEPRSVATVVLGMESLRLRLSPRTALSTTEELA